MINARCTKFRVIINLESLHVMHVKKGVSSSSTAILRNTLNSSFFPNSISLIRSFSVLMMIISSLSVINSFGFFCFGAIVESSLERMDDDQHVLFRECARVCLLFLSLPFSLSPFFIFGYPSILSCLTLS